MDFKDFRKLRTDNVFREWTLGNELLDVKRFLREPVLAFAKHLFPTTESDENKFAYLYELDRRCHTGIAEELAKVHFSAGYDPVKSRYFVENMEYYLLLMDLFLCKYRQLMTQEKYRQLMDQEIEDDRYARNDRRPRNPGLLQNEGRMPWHFEAAAGEQILRSMLEPKIALQLTAVHELLIKSSQQLFDQFGLRDTSYVTDPAVHIFCWCSLFGLGAASFAA